MPVFWLLFWGYFLAVPVVFGLSRLVKSKGRGISQTHRWVYAKSGRKHRNASVREAWEHDNPGKSWDKSQNNLANGCLVFLILLVVAFSIPFIGTVIQGGTETDPTFLTLVGAPVLGALGGIGYLLILTKTDLVPTPKEGPLFFVIDLLSMLTAGAFIIGGILFTINDRPLPFSHHWIWLPVLFPLLVVGILFLLSIGVTKQMNEVNRGYKTAEKAQKPPDQLSEWAVLMMMKLVEAGGASPPKGTENVFKFHAENLINLRSTHTLTGIVSDRNFFRKTEGLLSALARKERITITIPLAYEARDILIRAAQVVYLHGVKHGGYSMAPELKQFFK